jgi:hypothetical protein
MNLKKITALLLCVVLAASVLAGCSKTDSSPFVSDAAASSDPAASATSTLNMSGAYAALDPDTVMLTVNGKDTTWGEYFYLLNYIVTDLQSQGTTITDWSAIYADDKTYKDYVLDSVVNIVLQNAAIEYGAGQMNVVLSDENKAAVQTDWDTQVQSAGSEEALLAQLKEQFGSKELFEKLDGLSYLARGCFAAQYGSDAEKLTDQEVADYTAEDGYLMAKHILLMTSNTDESGNSTPMTDEEKAKVHDQMQEILDKLNGYSGNDFNAYFDELMNKYSQDTGGLSTYPNGYLFQSGDMVSQFEEATKALEIGKISGIVETDYGYHIIYRLPIDYNATPMAYSNYGTYSLRYIAATGMFQSVIDTWTNSLNIVYSDDYKALDFNKLFAAG